ncbi:MAG: phosphotransferase [Campylobacteraceae bacterium]|nr:phosphotransferase [Campylobacteraceae bacterium]
MVKKLKNQGLCNEVYKIKKEEKDFILRVFKRAHTVNINRKQEFKIQKKAFKKGIASKPVYLSDKFMTCHFLKGVHKEKLSKKDIKTLIKSLKKLHKIKYKKKACFLEKEFTNYKELLKDKKSKKIIKKSLEKIKNNNKKKDLVLCHNDLNKENIIFDNKAYFIDWEFASINNRFFDLATLCIKYNFSKKEEKILLSSYFPFVKEKYYKRLKNYKVICRNFWKLWFKTNI